MTRVSIVTPSYNQAKFLEQTIRSVLSQDYPDLEYCIVDGASQDDSPAIIEKYAPRLAWWVSEPDHGQAEAVNKGFARATGEIIGWVNSDDLFLPGAVSQAVAALESHPEWGMVCGDMLSIDEQSAVTNEQRFKDWGLAGLMQFQVIGQPAVFLRRSALESVRLEDGQYLDTRYHFLLDHQLWLRIAQKFPFGHIEQFLAAARYHAGAKNVAHAEKYEIETLEVARWMEDQPGLKPLFLKKRRQIYSGLYLYIAHYLLEANFPRKALGAYLHGLWLDPLATWRRGTALNTLRRMAFAFASMFVNVEGLRSRYLSDRKQRYAAQNALLRSIR